jgi:hypothetical protein
MANNGPMQISKSSRPITPNIRLQMARAEVLGCDKLPGIGGIVSFIGFNRVSCWFENALPDHYNARRWGKFNDFQHTPKKPSLPGGSCKRKQREKRRSVKIRPLK